MGQHLKSVDSLERELREAIEFCFTKSEELKRVSILSIPLNERMAHFSHIEDRGRTVYVEVGMDARQRIHEWCFRFLQRRNMTHVAAVSEAAQWIEEAIAYKFFAQRAQLNNAAVSRMIHRFERYLEGEVRIFRFFWPCQICQDDTEHEVIIGNVRLRPMALARNDIEAGIAGWGDDVQGVVGDQIRNYFKRFTWMADVLINAADKKAAKQVSLTCVQVALTIIRLFYGGAYSNRIRVAEEQNFLLERAELYEGDGKINMAWSMSSGQEPFPDNWWQKLNQGENAKRLRILDSVVNSIPFPERQTYLKRKLLNAMIWFNDAVIDTHSGAQISKFVNCLECLASCGERENLTAQVGDRIASLVGAWPTEGSFNDVIVKVKRVYTVRSELVHGTRDPLDLELGQIVQMAAHLAHMAIIAFVDLFFVYAQRTDYNNKLLAADYEILRCNISTD